ncbi:MAG TPA: dienelactone hydrolase family protein [Paracoccaceae bacterium]|nr:dienelactone hydrolase family protein [Paracoccaceae bacterium]
MSGSETGRSRARERLRRLLKIPVRALALEASDGEPCGDYVLERLTFSSAKERFAALLTRPAAAGPHPGLLYVHAHGNRYDIGARELIQGRPALASPLGPELARAGFVCLCMDLPCFGSRAGVSESALSKARLWQGGTLVGDMLGDLEAGLDWLAARPDVDPARIGLFGLSMGATLATWLAAIDRRPACLVQLLVFADLASLVATGAHDLHGPYLTIPGLLKEFSIGSIAGLVAPRPQFIGTGTSDLLTPDAAYTYAIKELRLACRAVPESLRELREPDSGHEVTLNMRRQALAFLAEHLRP